MKLIKRDIVLFFLLLSMFSKKNSFILLSMFPNSTKRYFSFNNINDVPLYYTFILWSGHRDPKVQIFVIFLVIRKLSTLLRRKMKINNYHIFYKSYKHIIKILQHISRLTSAHLFQIVYVHPKNH